MGYKSLSEHLLNSPNLKPAEEPVNEVLLTLIAASVLAFTCKPLLETDFMKSIGGGIGMMFGGIGSMFGFGARGKDKDDEKDGKKGNGKDGDEKPGKKDKDDEKDSKDNKSDKSNSSDSDKKNFNAMMQNMFAFCQKTIDGEKDKNKKESLNAMLDTIRAASVDKDGNPVDPEKMGERFKEITGKSPEDWAKDNGVEMPGKEEIEKIQDAAKKDIEGKSPEERKKIAEEGVAKAKAAGEKITKAREELETAQKELDELKAQAKDESDPEKKKNLLDKARDKANVVVEKTKALAGSVMGKKDVEQATAQAEETGNSENKDEGDKNDTPDKSEVDDAIKKAEDAAKEADDAVAAAQKALDDETDEEKKKDLQKALDDAKEKQKAAKEAAEKAKEAASNVSAEDYKDPDGETVESIEQAIEAAKKAAKEADDAVDAAQKAVDSASDSEKDEKQKELDSAKEKQKAAKDESDKHKDNKEEVFQVTHDGKPDKIIKRKKLRGEGHVYCYASDKKTTISPDVAKALIKKSSAGANESLASYLSRRLG